MKTRILTILTIVFMFAATNAFAQAPKMPDGAKLVSQERQQELEQTADSQLPELLTQVYQNPANKQDGNASTPSGGYAGAPTYGAMEARVSIQGPQLLESGVFYSTEMIPAGSTFLPYIINSGGRVSYLRGVSFEVSVTPIWIFPIEPGRIVGDYDWAGKLTYGMLVLGPEGSGTVVGETIAKNGFSQDAPQSFLSSPNEQGALVFLKSSRVGSYMTALLRERNGYSRYVVAIARNAADLSRGSLFVVLPDGIPAGPYVIVVNINGVSDTIDVTLTRTGSTTPGGGGGGSSDEATPTVMGRTISIKPITVVTRAPSVKTPKP